MILTMLYRLQAGVSLVDAILGKVAWAPLCAFGFRPVRRAIDSAAVTQILPELCRLYSLVLGGMSIDHVKCFHLMPHAMVLVCRRRSRAPVAPAAYRPRRGVHGAMIIAVK